MSTIMMVEFGNSALNSAPKIPNPSPMIITFMRFSFISSGRCRFRTSKLHIWRKTSMVGSKSMDLQTLAALLLSRINSSFWGKIARCVRTQSWSRTRERRPFHLQLPKCPPTKEIGFPSSSNSTVEYSVCSIQYDDIYFVEPVTEESRKYV